MRAIGNMLIVMVIASMVSCAKTTPKKTESNDPLLSNMRMNFSPLKCQRDGFVIPPVGKG